MAIPSHRYGIGIKSINPPSTRFDLNFGDLSPYADFFGVIQHQRRLGAQKTDSLQMTVGLLFINYNLLFRKIRTAFVRSTGKTYVGATGVIFDFFAVFIGDNEGVFGATLCPLNLLIAAIGNVVTFT